MTQNDLNFLQEAIGLKCEKLLDEIVTNHNTIAKKNEEKEEKKTTSKKGETK